MNDRDEKSPARQSAESDDPEVVRLQEGIVHTRAEMSASIAAIETRLSPAEVRDKVGTELKHVEERVREVVHEQLVEAKDLLRSEMNEAEGKIKRGLGEARDALKQEVKEAISGAKHAVRAATLGQVEDLATNIGDKMNEARETLIDTVRSNPVPAAVMGVGLVWLLMNRSKSGKQRSGNAESAGGQGRGGQMLDQVKDALSGAGNAASGAGRQISSAAGDALHSMSDATKGLAHSAGEAASHVASGASDTASSVAKGARQGVKRVEAGFQTQLQENPVALGAAALAIGAVVGFALPRTQREDSLMGDARDRLLHEAGDAAHGAAASAGHLAEQALGSITKTGQGESANA